MPAPSPAPTTTELAAALGAAAPLWHELVAALRADFPGLRPEWRPAKLAFGKVCLLRQKERTLVYLIPRRGDFEVSVVLGERAVALALAGELPAATKRSIAEAMSYAEGRGIRFPMTEAGQVPVVRRLVACKTTPK